MNPDPSTAMRSPMKTCVPPSIGEGAPGSCQKFGLMNKEVCVRAIWWVFMLTVLGLLAGCSKAPSDESISQALKASYFSDPQLKNEPIQIAVTSGEVTLSGEVSSDAARLQAYKLANETVGVKKVIDSMTVGSPVPPQAAFVPQGRRPSQEPETKGRTADRPAAASEAPIKARPEGGTRATDTTPSSAPAVPPATPAKQYTFSAGTEIRVQMIDSVNSKTSQVGATFQASLDSPLTFQDSVVVPKGANVYVKLVNAKSAGKITGQSELELELDHLEFQGNAIPLRSSTYQQAGESRGKQTATRTAIGTGIGAAIGAIAGGGKGAAIGAAIGAGGGMATQILTHGKEVQVPAETKLDFKLAESFEITIQHDKASSHESRTPVQPSATPQPKEEF